MLSTSSHVGYAFGVVPYVLRGVRIVVLQNTTLLPVQVRGARQVESASEGVGVDKPVDRRRGRDTLRRFPPITTGTIFIFYTIPHMPF